MKAKFNKKFVATSIYCGLIDAFLKKQYFFNIVVSAFYGLFDQFSFNGSKS